jgi:hypothetical protein
MRRYLDSIALLLQERTAEELIVGVFLALLLAIVGAGIHNLARRKVKDTVPLLTVVCLIANLVAMVASAGYVRMKGRGGNFSNPNNMVVRPAMSRGQIRDLTIEALSRTCLRGADLDRDGKLSADEAATVAARFVQVVEAEAGRPVDWEALALGIKSRVRVFDTQPVDPSHPLPPVPGLDGPFNRPPSGGQPEPTPHPPTSPRM